MQNRIIILTGSDLQNGPSQNREPYNIVWNAQVVKGDIDTYLKPGTISQHPTNILSLTPYTDYEPLDFIPIMACSSSNPFAEEPTFYPVMVGEKINGPCFIVPRIKELADSDRRGKLPKVIQLSFATYMGLGETEIIRYRLDNTNNRFLSLNITPVDDSICKGQIIVSTDDTGPVYGNPFDIQVDQDGSIYSLRMIIFGDRVVIHEGQPGTEISSLALPSPAICDNSATLEFFNTVNFIPYPNPDGSNEAYYSWISFLSLYDGYY